MTYEELGKAIQDYTANYEARFVANIPVFISQVEDRIYQATELPALRKTAYAELSPNNKFIVTPVDFLSPFSLGIKNSSNQYEMLLNKDVNWLNEAYQNDLVVGRPVYYAQFDANNFAVAPVPDKFYYIECNYFGKPPSIVDAGTSWVGDNVPSVLLYGSLVEAYIFMKGDQDIMAMYQSRYADALAALTDLGQGKNRMDAYRSGQVRTREKA